MTLVQRIRYLCDKRRINLAILERELGLANSSIRRWDERMPSVDRVAKVADYFKVSTDYLLGRDEKTKDRPPSPIDTIAAHLEGKEVTPDKMKDVMNYIDFIFSKEFNDK